MPHMNKHYQRSLRLLPLTKISSKVVFGYRLTDKRPKKLVTEYRKCISFNPKFELPALIFTQVCSITCITPLESHNPTRYWRRLHMLKNLLNDLIGSWYKKYSIYGMNFLHWYQYPINDMQAPPPKAIKLDEHFGDSSMAFSV